MTGGAEGWVWEGNDLLDSRGQAIASVRSDVLLYRTERLLIECEPGPVMFRVRATAASGAVYTMAQVGFTLHRLKADCNGKPYDLVRESMWRKTRIIENDHGVVAFLRPMVSGKVNIIDGPAMTGVDSLDVVFMSWGCVLADSAVRRIRT